MGRSACRFLPIMCSDVPTVVLTGSDVNTPWLGGLSHLQEHRWVTGKLFEHVAMCLTVIPLVRDFFSNNRCFLKHVFERGPLGSRSIWGPWWGAKFCVPREFILKFLHSKILQKTFLFFSESFYFSAYTKWGRN